MRNYMEQRCRKIILYQSCLFLAALILAILAMCFAVLKTDMNPKTAMIALPIIFAIMLPLCVWGFLAPAIYCFQKMRAAKKAEARSELLQTVVTNWKRSSCRKELSKVCVNIDGKGYYSYDCFYYGEASKIVGKQVECFLSDGKVVITKLIEPNSIKAEI